jgi:hypothetical protein
MKKALATIGISSSLVAVLINLIPGIWSAPKKMAKKQIHLLSCVSLVLLCIVIIAVGCRGYKIGPENNGYKEIRVSGDGRFSFEYPSNWIIDYIHTSRHYTEASLSGPPLKRVDATDNREYTVTSTSWWVTVDSVTSESLTAEAALRGDVLRLSWHDEFKVLEESDIEIAGLTARQVVFTYSAPQMPLGQDGPGGPPQPVVVRVIRFIHNGLMWHIQSYSNSDVAEADEVHLEHMLKTFKILD